MIETRIAQGVAWLDEYGTPGWWEDIDLSDLDMLLPTRCVLGQLYGNYSYAPLIGLSYGECDGDEQEDWYDKAVSCGFDIRVNVTDNPEDIEKVSAWIQAWREAIIRRRMQEEEQ